MMYFQILETVLEESRVEKETTRIFFILTNKKKIDKIGLPNCKLKKEPTILAPFFVQIFI